MWLRRVLLCVLTFLVCFGTYWSNGDFLGSSDSTPNSVLVFSVLERGKFDLDEFRGSYLASTPGQFTFTEAPNGHLSSLFPIGAAIVAAPIYIAEYVVRGAPLMTSSETRWISRPFHSGSRPARVLTMAAAFLT